MRNRNINKLKNTASEEKMIKKKSERKIPLILAVSLGETKRQYKNCLLDIYDFAFWLSQAKCIIS